VKYPMADVQLVNDLLLDLRHMKNDCVSRYTNLCIRIYTYQFLFLYFYLQLELLQRKVDDLSDTQNIAEDRTTRTKTEYAVLQARYHMLEEQYREVGIRVY